MGTGVASLNDQQQRAVDHRGDGPLLVIAGAGTGKTNTLAHRVARLIARGRRPASHPAAHLQPPGGRRARAARRATSWRERSRQRGLDAPIALPWAGTFHSVGREAAAHVRRARRPRAGLHDPRSRRLRGPDGPRAQRARASTSRSGDFPPPRPVSPIYSRVVNADERLADVLRDVFPRCVEWEAELKALFDAYVDAKQAQHVLDFDDLLLYWAAMIDDAALARGGRRRSSITCSSTSTRTPIACRRRSSSA